MKQLTLLLSILMFVFASCTIDEVIAPTEKYPCDIGYLEVHEKNVKFIKTIEADTIWCDYDNSLVMWIDGQIDWNCIGFTRRCDDFPITVMTRTDTCQFIIPRLENCNL